MIIGIDIDIDHQLDSSNIIGFVASINPTCTRYYSSIIYSKSHSDYILGLQISFKGQI